VALAEAPSVDAIPLPLRGVPIDPTTRASAPPPATAFTTSLFSFHMPSAGSVLAAAAAAPPAGTGVAGAGGMRTRGGVAGPARRGAAPDQRVEPVPRGETRVYMD